MEIAGRTALVTGAARGMARRPPSACTSAARTSSSSASSPSSSRTWRTVSATAPWRWRRTSPTRCARGRRLGRGRALRRDRHRRRERRHRLRRHAGLRPRRARGAHAGRQPARRLAHEPGGPGPDRRPPRLSAQRRLPCRGEPRAADGAVHGVEGGRRGAERRAANGAGSHGRPRGLRLLRLHRHRPGPRWAAPIRRAGRSRASHRPSRGRRYR